jgi:hypothetical protein
MHKIIDIYKMYLSPLHVFQQTSCYLQGVLAENCKNFLHPSMFPFLNSPSQIFQLFHPFKGYYLSYVFTSSCILISTQVHRCAGISCILSHPLPFKKYVRLAHGRYSHGTSHSTFAEANRVIYLRDV